MAGERGRVKAAREEIARWWFTPADIAALARMLADYNNNRPWPQDEAAAQKIEWLSIGHGCCERFGTARDARMGAWSALSAAMSILADVPLECPEDATAFLLLLIHTGWRHLPQHQQVRVARRMARFVGDRLTVRPFVPYRDGLGAHGSTRPPLNGAFSFHVHHTPAPLMRILLH